MTKRFGELHSFMFRAVQAMEFPGAEGHKSLATEIMRMMPAPGDMAGLYHNLRDLIVPVITQAMPSRELAISVSRDLLAFSIGSAYWATNLFPAFNLTTDFYRAIAVTDFGDAQDVPLKLPYPAMLIRYPEPMGEASVSAAFVFPIPTKGADEEVSFNWRRMSLACARQERQSYTQWHDEIDLNTFLHGEARLIDDADPIEAAATKMLGQQISSNELGLARRILGNMMLYIDSSGGLPSTKKLGADVPVEREHAVAPRFRVGRPIKLGPQIRAALRTTEPSAGWQLAHRFVVRGHWRNQAFGPAHTLRRRKFIEPYWKGPENVTDALLRTYDVK